MYAKIGKNNTIVDGLDPYDTLGAAIVRQAVDDYLRNIRRGKKLDKELKFFNSDWCEMLCGINGDAIMRKINMIKEA